MRPNLKKTVERIEAFRKAWEKNAATESFAGMTLEEFAAATKVPCDTAKEVHDLRKEAKRKRVHALNTLPAIQTMLERVVFAVQASHEYGPDSAFYQELGYVRKSDRKKGLTRKGKVPPKPEESPSTDAT